MLMVWERRFVASAVGRSSPFYDSARTQNCATDVSETALLL